MSRCMRRHELTLWITKRTAPCPQEAVASRRPDLGRSNLCNTLQEERSQEPHSQSMTFRPWRVVPFSLLTTGGVSCLLSDQVRVIALGIFTLGLISTMMLLLPAVWSRKPARRQAVRLLIRELRGGESGPSSPFASKGLRTPTPKTSKKRKLASTPSSQAGAESLQVDTGSRLAKPSRNDTHKAA